jgi:hypothetical protein
MQGCRDAGMQGVRGPRESSDAVQMVEFNALLEEEKTWEVET